MKFSKCHPHKRHYAKELCSACYSQSRPKQVRTVGVCIKCERFIKIVAKQMCQTCFIVSKRESRKLELLDKQDGKCAINGCTTDTSGYTLKDWCLDHDHSCCPSNFTGCENCTRGVLCRQCNALLGMSKDNTTILTGAIDYLERHRQVCK